MDFKTECVCEYVIKEKMEKRRATIVMTLWVQFDSIYQF